MYRLIPKKLAFQSKIILFSFLKTLLEKKIWKNIYPLSNPFLVTSIIQAFQLNVYWSFIFPSGFIVVTAALFVWCFIRFNVKKRFSKDTKCKSSKYFTNPVDLKVFRIWSLNCLVLNFSFHVQNQVVERLGKAYTEKVRLMIKFKTVKLYQ